MLAVTAGVLLGELPFVLVREDTLEPGAECLAPVPEDTGAIAASRSARSFSVRRTGT
jgi:hypothetical protein